VTPRLPETRAVRRRAPQAVWTAPGRRRALCDDREGRSLLRHEGQDALDSLRDLLVRSAHAWAGGIADEPDRGPHAAWALCGLLPRAPFQATAPPGTCRGTHGAFAAQAHAVMGMTWVSDACFVQDPGLWQGTDRKEAVPVPPRPRAAGDVQAEHGAGRPQADVGAQGLHASAPRARGTRTPLRVVDDGDLGGGPPAVPSPLPQVVWAGRTRRVFPPLEHRGRPPLAKGPPCKMVGAHGGEQGVGEPHQAPCRAARPASWHTARPAGPGGGPHARGVRGTNWPIPGWAPRVDGRRRPDAP
jgi:hypothetical protein